MAADDIGRVDAVLLTHDHHADNLDDDGRALLPSAGAVVTTVSGARRLGGAARGLDPWHSTVLQVPGRPALEVTATPCRHGPPGAHFIVGDVVGFAMRWDGQVRGALWISGDTVLYDGLRSVAGRVEVDLAIVHLGAVRFPITGPIRYTLSARTVVPVHYQGWSHFSEDVMRWNASSPARPPRSANACAGWRPASAPTSRAGILSQPRRGLCMHW